MINRLLLWLLTVLVAIDQLGAVLIFGVVWVLFNRGKRPNPDETISSYVGRHAIKGEAWALVAEKVIDTLFYPFGGWGHCRKRIEWSELV